MFHSFGSLVSGTYQHTTHAMIFWYGSKDWNEDGGKTNQNHTLTYSTEQTDKM